MPSHPTAAGAATVLATSRAATRRPRRSRRPTAATRRCALVSRQPGDRTARRDLLFGAPARPRDQRQHDAHAQIEEVDAAGREDDLEHRLARCQQQHAERDQQRRSQASQQRAARFGQDPPADASQRLVDVDRPQDQAAAPATIAPAPASSQAERRRSCRERSQDRPDCGAGFGCVGVIDHDRAQDPERDEQHRGRRGHADSELDDGAAPVDRDRQRAGREQRGADRQQQGEHPHRVRGPRGAGAEAADATLEEFDPVDRADLRGERRAHHLEAGAEQRAHVGQRQRDRVLVGLRISSTSARGEAEDARKAGCRRSRRPPYS